MLQKQRDCAICGKPATALVIIKDCNSTYKYAEGFRCVVHAQRAAQYFRSVQQYCLTEPEVYAWEKVNRYTRSCWYVINKQ